MSGKNATGLWNTSKAEFAWKPFPHLVLEEFLDASLYPALRASFPQLPESGGRTGYSLYRGDSDFEPFLDTNPSWRKLVDGLTSQCFVDFVTAQFGGLYRERGCRIDPCKAHYADFIEPRDMMREGVPQSLPDPEQVFVRVDIQQGRAGYAKKFHCDLRRRLASMLLFFCDKDEVAMRGGALALTDTNGNVVKKIAPRHNRAVIFPRFPTSFHMALEIESTRAPRDFLYVAVSSTHDLWPRKLGRVKRLAVRMGLLPEF